MERIENESIDLIIADPPYFNVVSEKWDRQWRTETEFIEWLEKVFAEFARILKPTGSLYLFCYNHMSAKISVALSKYLEVLSHIVWNKPNGRHLMVQRSSQRKYFPQTEHVLFAESKNAPVAQKEMLEPLRYYMNEWTRAGLTKKEAEQVVGSSARHYFNASQWSLPSKERYEQLRSYARAKDKNIYPRSYSDLQHEYMVRRKQARRPFSADEVDFNTDLWEFKTVVSYKGRHPCEKPLQLYAQIIKASSREGDTILDPFLGSGNSGVLAKELKRNFLGIEIDQEYFNRCKQKINNLDDKSAIFNKTRKKQPHTIALETRSTL
ncbi:hypothetical protein BGC07_17740 [Piscirickettsia litoralis]|uniref:Methyltransferase n=2 Tax=Piscirickettsia litoralis TaxID=1891921 RepID=A0ABX2ZX43_9GAMM|nr:hypothetical protein BGC07_17740 [Piscirickettsia litoralis]